MKSVSNVAVLSPRENGNVKKGRVKKERSATEERNGVDEVGTTFYELKKKIMRIILVGTLHSSIVSDKN